LRSILPGSPRHPEHTTLPRFHYSLNSLARREKRADHGGAFAGGVAVSIEPPKLRELVPSGFQAAGGDSQETLGHLRWMLQKDLLGQDVFLLGRPGPARRHLAWRFCEITGREAEYIAFTRDTSESDFKQRREITKATAHYVDQCAVSAAIEGRVLILDGIEKVTTAPLLVDLPSEGGGGGEREERGEREAGHLQQRPGWRSSLLIDRRIYLRQQFKGEILPGGAGRGISRTSRPPPAWPLTHHHNHTHAIPAHPAPPPPPCSPLTLAFPRKAERNVLPLLNNLLENREMHLEDGRFLLRYLLAAVPPPRA